VLIRAALSDREVPLHDPIRAAARLRRWMTQQPLKHQSDPHTHWSLQQQPQQQLEDAQGPVPVDSDSVQGSAQGHRPGRACSEDQGCGDVAAGGDVMVRVVPGGHTAFEGDVRESAFKLAFLLEAAARAVDD